MTKETFEKMVDILRQCDDVLIGQYDPSCLDLSIEYEDSNDQFVWIRVENGWARVSVGTQKWKHLTHDEFLMRIITIIRRHISSLEQFILSCTQSFKTDKKSMTNELIKNLD